MNTSVIYGQLLKKDFSEGLTTTSMETVIADRLWGSDMLSQGQWRKGVTRLKKYIWYHHAFHDILEVSLR